MASMLMRIRASSPALRPLRPLGIYRLFCDKKDEDDPAAVVVAAAGAASRPTSEKISLEDVLQRTKIVKPNAPMKLSSVKPPRKVLEKVPDIDAKTVKAAESAAMSLEGDVQKNVDALLQQLKTVSEESRNCLEDVLVGMKIDRPSRRPAIDKNQRSMGRMVESAFLDSIHFQDDDEMPPQHSRPMYRSDLNVAQNFNLFNGPRLNVFTGEEKHSSDESQCSLPYWDQLEEYELKLSSKVPPKNGFEELIQWTEEGKLWLFPIDNEFGMVEEANVKFEDHVFLDHLIQDEQAFPEGPLKRFMELVCVGLSRNPYISVARKHRCIEWYRQYFLDNRTLIEAAVEN